MSRPPSAPPRIPIGADVVALWRRTTAAEFLRAMADGTIAAGEHTDHTGNRLVDVPRPGHVVTEWTPGPRHANLSGGVHGGYLALVCDEAGGMAAASTGERFIPMLTLDLDITFLRPATVGLAHRVEGEVLHAGRQRVVVDVRVRTPDGALAATARGSFVPNRRFVETVIDRV